MTLATLTWFTLGAVLVFMVAQDPNVFTWLTLQSKLFSVWWRRQWFLIRHNPDSFWVRYEIHRNANRLAREIQKKNQKR